MTITLNVQACYIEHEQAFDRVNQENVINSLGEIGMDGTELKLIRTLYQIRQWVSSKIQIKTGVRQGCVQSPALFNLYTGKIFRNIDDVKGLNIEITNIKNLRERKVAYF